MAKKKKEIVPANKPLSSVDLGKKVAKGSPSLLFTGEGLGLIARYAYKMISLSKLLHIKFQKRYLIHVKKIQKLKG